MEKQKEEYDDEINLYDLWKVIAKRKILIIGLFIFIVGLTAINSFRMPNIYRGEAFFSLLISPELISPQEIITLIGIIDEPKQLRIIPKSNSNVIRIKLNTIGKSRNESKNKLTVTIDAKKKDVIPGAFSEVLGYLNNMDIIKHQISREKEILIRQKAELSDLIKSSPDLKVTYYKMIEAGKLTTTQFDPIEVEKEIIDIKINVVELDQRIIRLNNGGIEMAVQPYISDKPVSPKILRNIALAGMISLLLGIFLAAIIEYISNVKKRNNNSSGNSSME
ncbi:MAG: hypothetical protein CVU51_00780 [Deltaproteobacteria bacterium HGW-Deltaproteobacteria-1]|jgi:hypothetical protein|nr:MAG: hypothetical protein CVU51_00780 [Deltaproteobacteria bacterium HGW-Deltaproteobacteria-1]